MKSDFECTCREVHADAVELVRSNELATTTLRSPSEPYQTLGDPTRLRILTALSAVEELCVCDLSLSLSMTQSAVSHQLAVLRRTGLVKYRKLGKSILYSLDDAHIQTLLEAGKEHVCEIR